MRKVILGRSENVVSEPKERGYLGLSAKGFHRLVYWEWGAARQAPVLLCAHGLTRQGRDFDALAAALAPHYRIACPDIVGRGRSDWLADKAGYGYPQYCADMAALIARLGSETVDWLGTSMGGLIGMMLAASAEIAHPAPGAQRYRPARAQERGRASGAIRRQGSALPEPCRGDWRIFARWRHLSARSAKMSGGT